ncbi:MAG: hypothetical protein FMNOHCHN_03152 [Ignavibacteriaceae bacterium]|nr:hypothetical protein [Ignavibacteriaceae bacterium]
MLDPTNIPEVFDWRKAYFGLNDKYQIDLSNDALIIAKYKQSAQILYEALKRWTDLAGDKAPESDLAALRTFDSLMIEMANLNVSSKP